MVTPVNFRDAVNWTDGYHTINREERNLAAIFYHALLLGDNLSRFLDLIGYEHPVDPGEFAVFFEYAYLRDLWSETCRDHDMREVILTLLDLPNREELEGMTTLEFNRHFGAVPKPSTRYIQSPGNWSIQRYKDTIDDDAYFLKVCRFKWAFNAKPDIVIHTSHDRAVCIEAKFASGEGHYPSNPREIAEFERRRLRRVSQTELQAYMMGELLGIQARYVFLVSDAAATASGFATITWSQVFDHLDTASCPQFIQEWIDRLQ